MHVAHSMIINFHCHVNEWAHEIVCVSILSLIYIYQREHVTVGR
jgi:hypothetical protein